MSGVNSQILRLGNALRTPRSAQARGSTLLKVLGVAHESRRSGSSSCNRSIYIYIYIYTYTYYVYIYIYVYVVSCSRGNVIVIDRISFKRPIDVYLTKSSCRPA